MGFMSKNDFILGVEQEVQPLVMYIYLKPDREDDILFKALINGDNQMSYRISRVTKKAEVLDLYNNYIKDNNFNIVEGILGKTKNREWFK